RPDLAVVDLRMPPTRTDEGLRAALAIGSRHHGVGVVLLSQYLDAQYALRLLADGAPGRGYLLKDRITDLESFRDALIHVAGGETGRRSRGRSGAAGDPQHVRPPRRTDPA